MGHKSLDNPPTLSAVERVGVSHESYGDRRGGVGWGWGASTQVERHSEYRPFPPALPQHRNHSCMSSGAKTHRKKQDNRKPSVAFCAAERTKTRPRRIQRRCQLQCKWCLQLYWPPLQTRMSALKDGTKNIGQTAANQVLRFCAAVRNISNLTNCGP